MEMNPDQAHTGCKFLLVAPDWGLELNELRVFAQAPESLSHSRKYRKNPDIAGGKQELRCLSSTQ